MRNNLLIMALVCLMGSMLVENANSGTALPESKTDLNGSKTTGFDDTKAFAKEYPKDIKSPIDGTPIFFVASKLIFCDENGLKTKLHVEGGYLRGFTDENGIIMPPLLVKRHKDDNYKDGNYYVEVNGEKVSLVCEDVYLGITESDIQWAYSADRGVFEPTPEMRGRISQELKYRDPRKPPNMQLH